MSKKSKRAPAPRWAYAEAWRYVDGAMRGGYTHALDAMATARTIVIEPDQLAHLPAAADTRVAEVDLLADARLPFSSVFISVGRDRVRETTEWQGALCRPIYAALLVDSESGILCCPFYWNNGQIGAYGWTYPKTAVPDGFEVIVPREEGRLSRETAHLLDTFQVERLAMMNDEDRHMAARHLAGLIGTGTRQAMRVIYMLESANVDLVETPGPPRGHVAHGVPHYEVAIRQSRRSARREPIGDAPEWSHRWETRGHYKHHGEGTPVFRSAERDQPEKVLDLPRGRCVRVWCPPFVKGPEDKPLVPKRRVVV